MGVQKQQVTQTTSNIPTYLAPYATDVARQAQAMYNTNVMNPPIYGAERIAGPTAEQVQSRAGIMGLGRPEQFGVATDFLSRAGQYAPGQFDYMNVGQPNLQQYQMAAPQTFGQEQAQQYMSPYAQSVIDIQKREALRDAQRAQLAQNLGAARQGTYGGARQLLATTERERNLGTQMGDIQAKGLQAAYENAQAQFERDRTAQMGAAGQNLQALLGVQQLGTQTGLQALLANQQAQMEAQKAAEQSRQFGATQGLEAGRTLANVGLTQQQADLARLAAQEGVGALGQSLQQQRMDQAYQDFMRQYQNPQEQLSYYSNIIRGLPAPQSQTQTSYGQAPSAAAQLGGAGLGAASIYNLLKQTG